MSAAPLLAVEDLTVTFSTRAGRVRALEGVSFEVRAGEMVGVVGESGSGKSVTAFAMMGLLDAAARIERGRALFAGRDLLSMPPGERAAMRGRDLSMVFQNPRAALNPIRSVGRQIADVIVRHEPASARALEKRVIAALRQVRIPDPERRARMLAHEMSGGMCQRVGIAMALACAPKLLIADEPTTGLDVTTQAVVMDLIGELARGGGASGLLITHDLALAGEYCDRIVVMHAGHVVETAPTRALMSWPRHPYTRALIASAPSRVETIDDLAPIAGALPDLMRDDLPPCRFAERCARRARACDEGAPPLAPCGEDRRVACRFPA